MATTIINVHALQPMPASLLNRDDSGAQKTVRMGGTTRTRLSSYCYKRAIRTHLRNTAVENGAFALRTNELPGMVIEALTTKFDVPEYVAAVKVEAVFTAFGFKMKSPTVTSNSTFVHEQAAHRIAEAMAPVLDDITLAPPSKSKKADASSNDVENEEASAAKVKLPDHVASGFLRAFDVDNAVDLALFGRMLSVGDKIKLSVDGAVSVNHANSVDPAAIIDDFFVAVDDRAEGRRLAGGSAEAMSNNLGVSDLSAQVFYRTMAIDVDQLHRNLSGDSELVASAIAAVIDSFVHALPSAKQRSSNAGTRPSVVLVSIGGSRLTADNAFTRAIDGDNVVADATAALFDQVRYHAKFGVEHEYVALAGDSAADRQLPDPETFPAALTIADSLPELIELVGIAAGGKQ